MRAASWQATTGKSAGCAAHLPQRLMVRMAPGRQLSALSGALERRQRGVGKLKGVQAQAQARLQ